MILSSSAERSVWIWFADRRAGSATREISWRVRAVLRETMTGRMTSESRDTMMNTTGTMVVQVLSGPTRQMLRRSLVFRSLNFSEKCQQSAYQLRSADIFPPAHDASRRSPRVPTPQTGQADPGHDGFGQRADPRH